MELIKNPVLRRRLFTFFVIQRTPHVHNLKTLHEPKKQSGITRLTDLLVNETCLYSLGMEGGLAPCLTFFIRFGRFKVKTGRGS